MTEMNPDAVQAVLDVAKRECDKLGLDWSALLLFIQQDFKSADQQDADLIATEVSSQEILPAEPGRSDIQTDDPVITGYQIQKLFRTIRSDRQIDRWFAKHMSISSKEPDEYGLRKQANEQIKEHMLDAVLDSLKSQLSGHKLTDTYKLDRKSCGCLDIIVGAVISRLVRPDCRSC